MSPKLFIYFLSTLITYTIYYQYLHTDIIYITIFVRIVHIHERKTSYVPWKYYDLGDGDGRFENHSIF